MVVRNIALEDFLPELVCGFLLLIVLQKNLQIISKRNSRQQKQAPNKKLCKAALTMAFVVFYTIGFSVVENVSVLINFIYSACHLCINASRK